MVHYQTWQLNTAWVQIMPMPAGISRWWVQPPRDDFQFFKANCVLETVELEKPSTNKTIQRTWGALFWITPLIVITYGFLHSK